MCVVALSTVIEYCYTKNKSNVKTHKLKAYLYVIHNMFLLCVFVDYHHIPDSYRKGTLHIKPYVLATEGSVVVPVVFLFVSTAMHMFSQERYLLPAGTYCSHFAYNRVMRSYNV